MRILCFGDSNTYGYIPDGSGRFSENIRWTGLLQKKFASEATVIEEGLCGRNGLHFIQCACKFTDTCTTCNSEENLSKRVES